MKKHYKKIVLAALVMVCLIASIVGISLKSNVAKADSITLHFKWEGGTPHLYYSNVNNNGETPVSWPGIPMTQEENNWYSYTIADAATADIVISSPKESYQTTTFSRKSGEYWYDESRGWFTENPDAATVLAEDTAKDLLKVDNTVAAPLSADNTGITVHFCSGDWSKANVYYWNALPKNKEVAWPGESMKAEGNGYFSYTFSDVSKINLLFHDGSQQTEDLTLNKAGEWWYKDGKWTDYDPANEPTTGPVTTPAPFTRTDFRDETIYFVMTTRFYDGDKGNNAHCREDAKAQNPDSDPAWRGDFKGLIDKLDYIKALGFSAVWITPVVQNDSGYDYHGYHAYNFKKVDPRYESSDCTYQDLINAAHAKGMKIIQDVVLNHTCNYGEENLHQINKGWSYAERVSSLTDAGEPGNIYHHKGFADASIWGTYGVEVLHLADDCIDLETENPKVYNYLIDAYNKYINMGVDAFRVDTVKHISRLTFNKTFLPAFREAGGKDFFMFGETAVLYNSVWNESKPSLSVCFYTWKETKEYLWGDLSTNESSVEKHFTDQTIEEQPTSDNAFLKGNDYHTPDRSQSSGLEQIDFYMHWGFDNAEQAFRRGKEEDPYFNDSTYNVVYVDSHDYGPDVVQKQRFPKEQDVWAENLDLMFSFRGIPCIYYGSEIEFQKGKPIDVGPNAPLSQTGRAYFGAHIEGEVTTADFGVYSGATGTLKETLEYPLAKHIQRLNLIRRAVPALRKGQYSTEGCSGQLSYKRRYTADGTDSFACVTISGDSTFTGVPEGTYVDVITGDKVECNGILTAKCSGKGNMRVYVLQTSGAPNGKIGEDGAYLK